MLESASYTLRLSDRSVLNLESSWSSPSAVARVEESGLTSSISPHCEPAMSSWREISS